MFKSSINTKKKGGIGMVNIYVYECTNCKKQKRDSEDIDYCPCNHCSTGAEMKLVNIL